MLSVLEAKTHILSKFLPLDVINIPIEDSLGYILREDIVSNVDIPPFDNSSVDGFAVQVADIKDTSSNIPTTLRIIGDIPAGKHNNLTISAGECASIMTGAMIPEGANAVIMIEDTDLNGHQSDNTSTVRIYKSAQIKENFRLKGSDISHGQIILHAGRKILPQDIGILAMIGISSIPVRKRPRIAIISSGDELVPIDHPLQPGQIHDSNTYMLSALLRSAGCEIFNLGIAKDSYESVENLFLRAVNIKPDIIISSAGVGTGKYDYIKQVIEQNGKIDFWKVNMRPGKPLAFGNFQGIPFFGLPGNPVSSYVSFFVFVHPVLRILQDNALPGPQKVSVILREEVQSDGRESYLRAKIEPVDGKYFAMLTGHQGSSNLFSLVMANALLIIPSGVKSCPLGTEIEALLLEN